MIRAMSSAQPREAVHVASSTSRDRRSLDALVVEDLPGDHQVDRRVADGQAAEVEDGRQGAGVVQQQVLAQQVPVMPGGGRLDGARGGHGLVPDPERFVDVEMEVESRHSAAVSRKSASRSPSGSPRYQGSAGSSARSGTSMARSSVRNSSEVFGRPLPVPPTRGRSAAATGGCPGAKC